MSSRFSVRIRGDGVAALTCAHLLNRAGLGVALEPAARTRVPALLLSAQAMHLLADIFERNDLFSNHHRILSRRVAWGAEKPISIPHAGVVVPEDALLQLLPAPTFTTATSSPGASEPAAYTIHSVKPLPQTAFHHRFGTQKAASAAAVLKQTADASACYVESLSNGWLFLIPVNSAEARLFAVGAETEDLLARSALVADVVESLQPAAGTFDTAPSIASPVCASDWLACGSAAMTFDPICGDGTATAAREAILASAVLSAIAKGGSPGPLLIHYGGLLVGAMRRHLSLCLEFYATGGSGPWWTAQCELLRKGHEWCTTQLALTPEPRYRLQDFDLVPLETHTTP